jgi:hypothetical protein
MKKPGLIDRARTYYLELNDKGLYIIALGKATAVPNVRGALSQVIADEAVNFMQKKFEVEIVANEQRLSNGKLEEMATEKHSHFLPVSQVTRFKSSKDPLGLRIDIKGTKVSITLYCHVGYATEVQAMVDAIGKA